MLNHPALLGFFHIQIKPTPVDDLTWNSADYDSVHGRISSWRKRSGNELSLDVSFPPGCTGMVDLLCKDGSTVTGDQKNWGKISLFPQ